MGHTCASVVIAIGQAAKHADQDNFIPFILETGRAWLDTLTAPGQLGEEVPSQDDYTIARRTRPARAGSTCIVVEIRSTYLAVEMEP